MLKLNSLVDLVLVVGSDKDSFLDERKVPGQAQCNTNTKRHSAHEWSHDSSEEQNSSTPSSESGSGLELAVSLTNPDVIFQPKVLQIFSASIARYPERAETDQLIDYPYHLPNDCGTSSERSYEISSSGVIGVVPEETTDEDTEPTNANNKPVLNPQNSWSPRRDSEAFTPREYRRESLQYRRESLQYLGRRHTINSITLSINQCGGNTKMLSETVNKSSDNNGTSSAALLSSKSADMPLTTDQINALCHLSFPDGFRCYLHKLPPHITTYVFTDFDGERFYSVNLVYYRKVFAEQLETENGLNLSRYEIKEIAEINSTSLSDDAGEVYIPTCIILVSSYPYYNTLKACLNQLYTSILHHPDQFDEELAKFAVTVTNTPVPPPSGDLSLSLKLSNEYSKIEIHPPSHPSRTVLDLDAHLIFSVLKPRLVCSVIAALLQEQRLVFVSSDISLLTLVQETVMAFIYPFQWQATYVPVLTSAQIDLVEVPGFFVMGCHRENIDFVKSVDGIIIVDLDSKSYISNSDEWIEFLPLKASSPFCTKLVDLKMNFDLFINGQVTVDLASQRQKFYHKLNKIIQETALTLMVDLFGDVTDYCKAEQAFFNQDSFLEAQSPDDQTFYRNVIDTTMFKTFLRQRITQKSPDLFSLKVLALSPSNTMSKKATRVTLSSKDKTYLHLSHRLKAYSLPYLHNLTQYFDDCLINLGTHYDLPDKNGQTRCTILYLMGVTYLQRRHIVDALNTFGEIHDMNSSLFPEKCLAKVLKCLEYQSEVIELVHTKYQKLYKGMCLKSKIKSYHSEVKVEFNSLPSSPVSREEFMKYGERLDLAFDRSTLDRLFRALTSDTSDRVDPDVLKLFYESWKSNEANCRDMEVNLEQRCPGKFTDKVLKVSSSVRSGFGLGHLILTQREILFLKPYDHDDPVRRVAKYGGIKGVDLGIGVGVKLMVPANDFITIQMTDGSRPYNVHLKDVSRLWKAFIDELVGGKDVSSKMKDDFIMQQAGQTVVLLDALSNTFKAMIGKYGKVLDLEQSIEILTQYSKEETRNRLLFDVHQSEGLLLYKFNPNADELDNAGVECILYIAGGETCNSTMSYGTPLSTPTIWCGMSNGKVKVFDANSYRLFTNHIQADDRVVCITSTGTHVWAGSFDNHIYVIENDPMTMAFEKLSHHGDYVIGLEVDPNNTGIVYSASINGDIFVWDADKLRTNYCIKYPFKTLRSFKVISQDEIWCCGKDSIVKLNSRGQTDTSFNYVDEGDRRHNIECFCVVNDNIWAGFSSAGRLVVWNKKTEERLGIIPLETKGISRLVAIDDSLYVGCKYSAADHSTRTLRPQSVSEMIAALVSPIQPNYSKMYIINTTKYTVDKEFSVHCDSIKSMSAVGKYYVMTGSGSLEGKVAVWKHQVH